ncbi:Regulator of sigma-W protease RasP [Granulicatella adiacens]|uniref:RIP metalloprotease RseP n=1 Tax=Granulicatella TaxID=117563 RepID=UPI00066EB020|nr:MULTISPECIES: RIP metalloprotease RseP [Granulicatella]MBF0993450.1 RIP metalloprotease RseP [Granulicatella sp.]MCT2160172.1 RIP metalloprotease RseP [Granulicatella adiacens]OFS99859.1 metalloprotease RseP [Granulicatella sp. HMSC31F03]VTX58622.1 Regulator of sigma-W protease RasP [Granulicatella adiacens]
MQAIIAFLFVFSVIVIIHEFGHYYFAKKAGILVREFAIGMGPKIFQVRKGETVYTLRLLPIGGYVRMAGHDEDEQEIKPGMMITIELDKENIVQKLNFDEHLIIENSVPFQIEEADLHRSMTLSGYFVNSEEKVNLTVSKQATIIESDGTEVVVAPIERQFNSASLWNRIKTNAAGPMNNFILSIIIFIIVGFMQGGVPSNDPVIGQVSDQSAAHEAGLQTSDKIISIDGVDIHSWDEMTSIVRSSADKTLSMTIQRNGDTKNVSITPKSVEGQNGSKIGQLGVTRTLDNSILSILGYGFTQTISVIVLVLSALGSIFTKGFNLNQLGGPVAIYSLTSQVAKNGLIDLLSFMGMISANLGVMNLLPIPALDGGKLVLNFIEGIRKKPLDPEKEGYLTIAGAIFLFALMLLVTWNDIMKLFN